MQRIRVKICCIASTEEAALAVSEGADAVGLVGAMPSGPGVITDEVARQVALAVPPPVTPWLLTSEESADAILDHARTCAVGVVQIVRHVAPGVHDALATRAPWLKRVQVIHVEGADALDILADYGERPHAFLLDSGRPGSAELGGTGRRHDWAVSAQFVRAAPRPVFLAGGLNPQNAAEAVRTVAPFGLDICSGVRTDGALDPSKLAAFVAAAGASGEEAPLQRERISRGRRETR